MFFILFLKTKIRVVFFKYAFEMSHEPQRLVKTLFLRTNCYTHFNHIFTFPETPIRDLFPSVLGSPKTWQGLDLWHIWMVYFWNTLLDSCLISDIYPGLIKLPLDVKHQWKEWKKRIQSCLSKAHSLRLGVSNMDKALLACHANEFSISSFAVKVVGSATTTTARLRSFCPEVGEFILGQANTQTSLVKWWAAMGQIQHEPYLQSNQCQVPNTGD